MLNNFQLQQNEVQEEDIIALDDGNALMKLASKFPVRGQNYAEH